MTLTLGVLACGHLPMDGDLSPAALAARATREMHAALFVRATLNTPPPPRAAPPACKHPQALSPKRSGFPVIWPRWKQILVPGSKRVKGKLR